MSDVIFKELWLHSVCDFEPESVNAVLDIFQTAENAFGSIKTKTGEEERKALLPKRFLRESTNVKHIKNVERLLEYCNKKGIRIITMDSDEYPYYLKNVYLPPRILFAMGRRLNLDNSIGVSVVGCRKATVQGKNIAEQIGFDLAKNGITVVSGLAEGIDAAAHEGALNAGGTTIAVLAGGVEDIYPKSNKGIYYRILESGTVLSERPPATSVKKYFYQQRNRIIVGLSSGVVIAEGKIKSGTAITARLATENNRDIFAVPGSPTVWQAELPNSLISDGAAIIDKIGTPAEYYKELYPDKVKTDEDDAENPIAQKTINGLTDEDKIIVEILKENSGVATAEMIAEKSNIPVNRINGRMTILSIKGVVKQQSGNRFVLTRNV